MYKENEPPKETKPKYEPPVQKVHEHKWIHMGTDKQEDPFPYGYNRGLTRKDQFFCEKCLERKTIVKKGTKYINEDYPDWW